MDTPINFFPNNTSVLINNELYVLYKLNTDMTFEYYININPQTSINFINTKLYQLVLINSITYLNTSIYKYTLDSPISSAILNTYDLEIMNKNIIYQPKKFSIENNLLYCHFTDLHDYEIADTIRHTRKVGHNNVNLILNIEKQDEYLYYFNYINPSTYNSYIYIHPKIDSDYADYDIFKAILKSNIKSNLFYQNNNISYFTLDIYIDQINNYNFLQKNLWIISEYTYIGNILKFNIPLDFNLIISKNYYYLINDTLIDSQHIIFNNNVLTINMNLVGFNLNSSNFKLIQIFIDMKMKIFIPDLFIKYIINFQTELQYIPVNIFYIAPYLLTLKDAYPYLYKIKLVSRINISIQTSCYLYSDNTKYKCLIFGGYDIIDDYFIIALQTNLIDLTLEIDNSRQNYIYEINNVIYNVIDIKFYQNIIQFCQYHNQTSLTSIEVFMGLNNYNEIFNKLVGSRFICEIIPMNNILYNIYLISYNEYNLFDNYTLIQNSSLKQHIIQTQMTRTISYIPKWNSYFKFFNYIHLYFNDVLIEELNDDIFNINYYLYSSEETRKQIDKLTQIKFTGYSWIFHIPLIFWFSKKSELALPLIALPYTEIKIKYKFADLKSILILSDDMKLIDLSNFNPDIKINLITEYILLDLTERQLFGSYSHEYLISKYKIYKSNYINVSNIVINQKLSGLIKDIYLISKPLNYPSLNYIPEVESNYDNRYAKYLTSLNYYNNYILTNLFTSQNEYMYIEDINIIKENLITYNKYLSAPDKNISEFTYINLLIDNFQTLSFWDENLLKYLLYFINKYLSSAQRKTKMNNNKNRNIIYILTQYLLHTYKNEVKITEISPITSLKFTVNGTDLFNALDSTYYNSVVPYTKFKNTLPIGYYVYSFSLYPLDDQPSGHQNFTNFDTTTIEITSAVTNNIVEPYKLTLFVKDYNIIRIMSGMGSLAWID